MPKMPKTPKKQRSPGKRRAGVTLVEVLISLVVLTVAIFASIETIGYTLSITTEVRGRMKNYAQLEHAGLLSLVSGDIPVSGTDDIECLTANLDAPITIAGTAHQVGLTRVVYRYDPKSSRLNKMASPVFVVFLEKI
ncbi:MAG: prepilin-type N-terminal cleavage/methylation domain-containing protein [Synergistaceae bacterium]|jgi:Tfp pilus assembly protein PilV|nr:prepilin-type N-terminal cleavage/methylation domain-containing protein [Synergistaceae bacterium]